MRHVAAKKIPSASYGRPDPIHVDRFADVSPRSSSSTVEINGRIWKGLVGDLPSISVSQSRSVFLAVNLDEPRSKELPIIPSQALLWPRDFSNPEKRVLGVDGQG